MQTQKYRVECVDRDTGAKTFHVFDAVDANAATDLANRMGFLVGEAVEVPTDQRRAFPWGVALGSLVLGVAIGAGGLFAAVNAGRVEVPGKPANALPVLGAAEPMAKKPMEASQQPVPVTAAPPIVTELKSPAPDIAPVAPNVSEKQKEEQAKLRVRLDQIRRKREDLVRDRETAKAYVEQVQGRMYGKSIESEAYQMAKLYLDGAMNRLKSVEEAIAKVDADIDSTLLELEKLKQ
jgi:hypothetical protein